MRIWPIRKRPSSSNQKINLTTQIQPKSKNFLEFRSIFLGDGNARKCLSGTPLVKKNMLIPKSIILMSEINVK
jgi:hypothetical protein